MKVFEASANTKKDGGCARQAVENFAKIDANSALLAQAKAHCINKNSKPSMI